MVLFVVSVLFESSVRTREDRDSFVKEVKEKIKSHKAGKMSDGILAQEKIRCMNQIDDCILDISSAFEAPPFVHVMKDTSASRNIRQFNFFGIIFKLS